MRRTGYVILITTLTLGIILSSCSKYKVKKGATLEERMNVAMKMFNNGDYYDAKSHFRIITLSHSGSRFADQAQFYLAECHYNVKEYILAASEYERLLKVYPTSEFVDDAKFKLGMSYFQLSPHYGLDQKYTRLAIQHFQEFLEDYYASDLVEKVERNLIKARTKLAHKVFESGDIYRKMGHYRSAKIYYNKVMEEYYDTKYAPMALYWIGQCNLKLDKPKLALEVYKEFARKYSNHEWMDRVKDGAQEAQEKIRQM